MDTNQATVARELSLAVLVATLRKRIEEKSCKAGREMMNEEMRARALSITRSIDRFYRASHMIEQGLMTAKAIADRISRELLDQCGMGSSEEIRDLIARDLGDHVPKSEIPVVIQTALADGVNALSSLNQSSPMFALDALYRGWQIEPDWKRSKIKGILDNLTQTLGRAGSSQNFQIIEQAALQLKSLDIPKPETLSETRVEDKVDSSRFATVQEHHAEVVSKRLSSRKKAEDEKAFAFAVSLLEVGNYADAISVLSGCLTLVPRAETTWFNMGLAYMGHEDYVQAIRCLKKAVQINPNQSRSWLELGVAQNKIDVAHPALRRSAKILNLRRAVRSCRRAIRLTPALPRTWNVMGISFGEMGRLRKAQKCLREAVTMDPRYAEAWSNLGSTYVMTADTHMSRENLRRRALEESLECCKKAVELDSQMVEAWNTMGVTHMALGEIDKALDDFKEAVAANPLVGATWMNLSFLYSELGNEEESRRCMLNGQSVGVYISPICA